MSLYTQTIATKHNQKQIIFKLIIFHLYLYSTD